MLPDMPARIDWMTMSIVQTPYLCVLTLGCESGSSLPSTMPVSFMKNSFPAGILLRSARMLVSSCPLSTPLAES
jgi:hypothetical protein